MLVAIIWIVSRVFRKAQPDFHYWLWCIVLLRLPFPFNISVPTGITHHFRNTAEEKLAAVVDEYNLNNHIDNAVTQVAPTHTESDALAEKPQMRLSTYKISFSELMALAWFTIFSALVFFVFFWYWHVYQLTKICKTIERPDIIDFVNKKCHELDIKQKIQLYVFNESMPVGPTVTGLKNPRIFLPYLIVDSWSIKDIEPVILHELIHIKRRDLLVNWIQIAVQVVYFFHPMVWFANWKIREYREELCDDITIQLIERKRKRYSLSILNVLEGILYEPVLTYADIGFSERKSSLAKRIIRISNNNYSFHKSLNVLSVGALVVISVLSISLACEQYPATLVGDNPGTESVVWEKPAINQDRIIIKIIDNGEYEVDGIPADSSEIEKVIKKAMKKSNKIDVIINTNPDTQQSSHWEVLNILNKLNIDRIKINKPE